MADELRGALFFRNEGEHQQVSTSPRSRPMGIAARAAALRQDKRRAEEMEPDQAGAAARESSSAHKKAKNQITFHTDSRRNLFGSFNDDAMQDEDGDALRDRPTPDQSRSRPSGVLSLTCRDRDGKGGALEVVSPFGDLDVNLLALIADNLIPRSSKPECIALPDIESMGKVNMHWNAVLNDAIGDQALELVPQHTETNPDGKSVTAAKSRLQLARELHVESQRMRVLSGPTEGIKAELESLYSDVEWHGSLLAQELAAMRALTGKLFTLASPMLGFLCTKALPVLDMDLLAQHCAALLASRRSDRYFIIESLFEQEPLLGLTTAFIDQQFAARLPLFGAALVGHQEKSLMASLYLRGSAQLTADLIDRHGAQLLALSPESDEGIFKFRQDLMRSLFQIRCNGMQFFGQSAQSIATFIAQQRAAILGRTELQLPRALKVELLKDLYEAAESIVIPEYVIGESAAINADACLSESDKRILIEQLHAG